MGRLFVFMGKSASGKDTLYGELLARYPEIHAVIPIRPGRYERAKRMAERIILSPKIKCAGWKKRTGLWNQDVIRPSMDRGIISRRKMDRLTGTKAILC